MGKHIMALTTDQIDILKSTVPIIRDHGTTVTSTFYANLLAAHPALKNYLSLRNQQTGAQQAALAHAVLAYASNIEDLGRLSSTVDHIAHKHASLFIKPEHYPIVGEFLIGAFGQVLGDAFTPDVKSAWVAAYDQLARIFIQRESELYEEAGSWKTWCKVRISGKEQHNDSVTHFYLEPVDGRPLLQYLPGQYVSVQIPIPQLDGLLQSRQFSLSEVPVEGLMRYRVSVKKEDEEGSQTLEDMATGKVPGLVSTMLHNDYNVGDEVEISPPRGDFFIDPSQEKSASHPLVLISAGVGATPMMAILGSVLGNCSPTRSIQWIHTAQHSGNACFTHQVRDMAQKHGNLHATVFLKERRDGDVQGREYDLLGRMTTDRLRGESILPVDGNDAQYFLCGPQQWMLELRGWLESQGVGKERVHLELFGTGGFD